MDNLPDQHIDSLPKQKRRGAYRQVGMVCAFRSEGREEDQVAKRAKFESVDEMLEELRGTVRLVEDLSLGYQGKRFAGMYTFEGDWTFPRSSYSSQRWQELCRQHGQNPNVESFSISGVTSNHPTEAGPYPPREVVVLIAAYALTDRPIEPLLKVLYPEHSEADIEELNKLLYETKLAGGSQNGL